MPVLKTTNPYLLTFVQSSDPILLTHHVVVFMHRGGGIHQATSNEALASLRQEISELRSRLASRTSDGLSTPDSPLASHSPFCDPDAEWRSKYDRLYESYRRVQKTNAGLEDKLLRVVDKFETEKNQMTRDLAAQTQKLVEAKLTIQRLSDQSRELQSDLNLSITLLRNKPNSYVSPKIEALPPEVRGRVKNYIEGKSSDHHKSKIHQHKDGGKKIRVAIPDDLPLLGVDDNNENIESDRVSAAILAKVLEERDKERRAEAKFCIDVGTQTQGWHLTNSSTSPQNNSDPLGAGSGSSLSSSASASPPFSSESSRRMILSTTPEVSETMSVTSSSSKIRMPISSNILLASVIHPAASKPENHQQPQHSTNFRENDFTKNSTHFPVNDFTKIPPPLALPPPTPPIMNNSMTTSLTASNLNSIQTYENHQQPRINVSSLLQRSATFSSMQTDI